MMILILEILKKNKDIYF